MLTMRISSSFLDGVTTDPVAAFDHLPSVNFPTMQTRNKLILFLIGLAVFGISASGKNVERCGYSIAVPSGWIQGTGTCTGDWSYSRVDSEGNMEVGLSVGERRYLEKTAELRSTADLYDISCFADIATVVPETLESDARLIKSEKLKSKKGAGILVLRFVGAESPTGPKITTICAFIETDAKKSALEIACRYVEGKKPLGEEVFKAALESVTDPKFSNGSQQPAPAAVH